MISFVVDLFVFFINRKDFKNQKQILQFLNMDVLASASQAVVPLVINN